MNDVARIADHFLSDLEQLLVESFADLRRLGIVNGQHCSFSFAGMIRKGEMNFSFPDLSEDSGDHPHPIPQQRGIEWIMNIGGDHRTIDACISPLLYSFVLGMCSKDAIDRFPSTRRDALDGRCQSGFADSFVGHPYPAEGAIAA